MKKVTPKAAKTYKVHTTFTTQTSDWSLEDIWRNLTRDHSEVQNLEFEIAGVGFKASFRETLEYWGNHPDGDPDESRRSLGGGRCSIRVSLENVVLLEGKRGGFGHLWWPCLTYEAFLAKIIGCMNEARCS